MACVQQAFRHLRPPHWESTHPQHAKSALVTRPTGSGQVACEQHHGSDLRRKCTTDETAGCARAPQAVGEKHHRESGLRSGHGCTLHASAPPQALQATGRCCPFSTPNILRMNQLQATATVQAKSFNPKSLPGPARCGRHRHTYRDACRSTHAHARACAHPIPSRTDTKGLNISIWHHHLV